MAFFPPSFNLTANVWLGGVNPSSAPPDLVGIPCQVYRYSRLTTASPQAIIRIPVAFGWTDGPAVAFASTNPIMECPAGAGVFYRINAAVWMHRGFSNQYIALRADPLRVSATAVLDSASDTDLL
jgi:hypothetical protein